MSDNVFNRFEQKYMISDEDMLRLCDSMPGMVADKYCSDGSYGISSLYYDTEDDLLVRTSLQKPPYREKLRMRCYGTPTLDSMVYVEIKKKVCKRGNKRRSAMRLGEAYRFLETAELPVLQPYMNSQVLREIQFMLQANSLMPRMLISYDRQAYTCKSRPDLRITFDNHIRTRRRHLRLEYGSHGQLLLPDNKWLMEIKVSDAMPVWLVRLLSDMGLFPISFSKYGDEYKKAMASAPVIYGRLPWTQTVGRGAVAAI